MRIIAHIDMDAFFASVEEGRRPYLAGSPIVVGADPKGGEGRGVVATANYSARAYGIRSAMPIREAWRRSEEARRRGDRGVIFISPHFGRYAATSKRIMQILRRFAGAVEEASIDEAYADLSAAGAFPAARKVGEKIKAAIRREEGLSATIGIGPNKLVAKIASEAAKPDGLLIVPPEDVVAFLDPLPIRKIPGVGPKGEILFQRLGVSTVADAKRLSRERLHALLGARGSTLYERLRGRDASPIARAVAAKSVGEEETFEQDTLAPPFLLKRVSSLADSVMERLRGEGFSQFRTIVFKVRFEDFETKTRSRTLSVPAASAAILERHALQLLMPFLDARANPRGKKIRLLGIRLEKISDVPREASLFAGM